MTALLALLVPIQAFNDVILRIGRWVSVVAIACMVAFILAQVFFRYVLNNALPWPDEAARFMMLWMTGLLAPAAYRRGGFVAIEMFQSMLPARLRDWVILLLLLISTLVLIVGVRYGYKHTASGCLFKSSTLWLPFTIKFALPIPFTSLDLTLCTRQSPAFSITFGWTKMPLAVMFASLYVGFILMLAVNAELLLRRIVTMLGGAERLRPIPELPVPEAE